MDRSVRIPSRNSVKFLLKKFGSRVSGVCLKTLEGFLFVFLEGKRLGGCYGT